MKKVINSAILSGLLLASVPVHALAPKAGKSEETQPSFFSRWKGRCAGWGNQAYDKAAEGAGKFMFDAAAKGATTYKKKAPNILQGETKVESAARAGFAALVLYFLVLKQLFNGKAKMASLALIGCMCDLFNTKGIDNVSIGGWKAGKSIRDSQRDMRVLCKGALRKLFSFFADQDDQAETSTSDNASDNNVETMD